MENTATIKKMESDPFSYMLELNTSEHNLNNNRINKDISVIGESFNYDSNLDRMKKRYGYTDDIYFYLVCPFWMKKTERNLNVTFITTKGTSDDPAEGIETHFIIIRLFYFVVDKCCVRIFCNCLKKK